MKSSQHRCVAADTIFCPAASAVSKSNRTCTVVPITCGVKLCSWACELAVWASFSNCACRAGTSRVNATAYRDRDESDAILDMDAGSFICVASDMLQGLDEWESVF